MQFKRLSQEIILTRVLECGFEHNGIQYTSFRARQTIDSKSSSAKYAIIDRVIRNRFDKVRITYPLNKDHETTMHLHQNGVWYTFLLDNSKNDNTSMLGIFSIAKNYDPIQNEYVGEFELCKYSKSMFFTVTDISNLESTQPTKKQNKKSSIKYTNMKHNHVYRNEYTMNTVYVYKPESRQTPIYISDDYRVSYKDNVLMLNKSAIDNAPQLSYLMYRGYFFEPNSTMSMTFDIEKPMSKSDIDIIEELVKKLNIP